MSQLQKRKALKKKAKKEQGRKKVRSFAERNRAKNRANENMMRELNFEERLDKKLKSGKITQQEHEEALEKMYRKYEPKF
jgi:hypothetical protein